jgi:hydrogenase/urease accessory protein HupE
MKTSWKTTTAGVAGIAIAILSVAQATLDGDPLTVPNWEAAIAAVVTGLGLLFARDNNVTSEQAGAKGQG